MTLYNIMGWGKGKTTSAIGMAIRALYNDEYVMFVQFLKDGQDGGLKALKWITEDECFNMGDFIYIPQGTKGLIKENCSRFWESVVKRIEIRQPDLVIFDELNVALDYNLFSPYTQDQMIEWIKLIAQDRDVYITGRINNYDLRHKMISISDVVSNCYCEKHSYNRQCPKCGMEYNPSYIYCPLCGEELKESNKARTGREW